MKAADTEEGMARRVIEVLLTDAEIFPKHGGDVDGARGGKWARWRGKPIRIVTPPAKPANNWECGTDVVFKLTPETIEQICGDGNGHRPIYVCRHQIQIGD